MQHPRSRTVGYFKSALPANIAVHRYAEVKRRFQPFNKSYSSNFFESQFRQTRFSLNFRSNNDKLDLNLDTTTIYEVARSLPFLDKFNVGKMMPISELNQLSAEAVVLIVRRLQFLDFLAVGTDSLI